MFKIISSICGIFLLLGLSSCITDALMPTVKYGSFTLNIERTSEAGINTKIQESTPRDIRNIVLTIKDNESNGTDYTLKTLEVYEFQGFWLTEKINLPVGSYQITTIHLTDTAANILYATPEKNSILAKQIQQPLPLSFQLNNNSEKGIDVEVVSTEYFSPKDFGFDPALVHFKESFFFFVALVKTKVDEIMEFLPGEISVSSNDYSYKKSLDAGVQKIALQKGFDNYTIQIDSDRYSTYENTFSYDSLLLYSSNPLILEFQRNTGSECLGGSHVGDVLLLSQEDVDNFGKKCYTHIEGSLQIGTLQSTSDLPISDLGPLETLREISKDLLIINNPDLSSLLDLQYLEKAENVRLESNTSLSSFYGLRRLRGMRAFSSINNSSLTGVSGLPWEDIVLYDLDIAGSNILQNLREMEELTEAQNITISNNPLLPTIDLPNIQTNNLTIEGNNSLTSLAGFNNSNQSLSSISIRNNPLLKDLQGILAPGAVIERNANVRNNASLTSLNGLRFSEAIVRLEINGNPSLQDISALSDIHQIYLFLEILNNDQLKSLKGLENLLSVGDPDRINSLPVRTPDLSIVNNKSLTDFCALTYLFQNATVPEWEIKANAFNPALSDFLHGDCAL